MTLSTMVWVLDPVEPEAVFEKGRELVGAGPEHTYKLMNYEPIGHEERWHKSLHNSPGQGLPAWLRVNYKPGEPLVSAARAAADPDGDLQACWLSVDFDTAYGYEDENGGCGELHALLVAKLGAWLDNQHLHWSWRNEFTGETWGGPDRYRRLFDLVRGGRDAEQWYRSTVAPVIASELVAGMEAEVRRLRALGGEN